MTPFFIVQKLEHFKPVKLPFFQTKFLSHYTTFSLFSFVSMAFKKTLAQRLFNAYKTTNFSISTCRIIPSSSSMASKSLTTPCPDNKIAPDPGDNGTSRRFLHRYPSPAISPDLRSLPSGEKLIEKLREMDTERNRIRLDGLLTPEKVKPEETLEGKLTVEDARKLLKFSQLEMVKLKLKKVEKNCISYSEFVQICCESCSNSTDQCLEFSKILDDSGSVIVLGNVVFLRPDQVGFPLFHSSLMLPFSDT